MSIQSKIFTFAGCLGIVCGCASQDAAAFEDLGPADSLIVRNERTMSEPDIQSGLNDTAPAGGARLGWVHGRLFALWTGAGSIKYTSSADEGASWASVTTISHASLALTSAALVLDADNNPALVFEAYSRQMPPTEATTFRLLRLLSVGRQIVHDTSAITAEGGLGRILHTFAADDVFVDTLQTTQYQHYVLAASGRSNGGTDPDDTNMDFTLSLIDTRGGVRIVSNSQTNPALSTDADLCAVDDSVYVLDFEQSLSARAIAAAPKKRPSHTRAFFSQNRGAMWSSPLFLGGSDIRDPIAAANSTTPMLMTRPHCDVAWNRPNAHVLYGSNLENRNDGRYQASTRLHFVEAQRAESAHELGSTAINGYALFPHFVASGQATFRTGYYFTETYPAENEGFALRTGQFVVRDVVRTTTGLYWGEPIALYRTDVSQGWVVAEETTRRVSQSVGIAERGNYVHWLYTVVDPTDARARPQIHYTRTPLITR